ncbi:MAG TPA: hypothetical protein VNW29_07800 [Candidatus Sulfotelmatobacter sp.]|jgi:hypothetical protein|nr:hypothetical protein [Candidatus Sulfotelmatobacter sp.]
MSAVEVQHSNQIPWRDVSEARHNSPREIYKRRLPSGDNTATELFTSLIRTTGTSFNRTPHTVFTRYQKQPHQPHTLSYAAVVTVPIDAMTETVDGIIPTFSSLTTAASLSSLPTYLLVNTNYTGDERRQKAKLTEDDQNAQLIENAIARTVAGGNIELAFVKDHLPEGTTISQIRQRMILTAARDLYRKPLGTNYSDNSVPVWNQKEEVLYRLPLFTFDADSVLAVEALEKGSEILGRNGALFVNGTHHYTGGVMELTPDQVTQRTTNEKFIYITEMMRRKMFDHLPSSSYRGYLLENGLGSKLGALVTLGGINPYSAQNESFFLLEAANQALDNYGNSLPNNIEETPASIPYLHKNIAGELEQLVYYAPYVINTSARGIEATVDIKGLEALVGIDQGFDYRMWTDIAKSQWQSKGEIEYSSNTLVHLLNSIYSYFKEQGGQLFVEDAYQLKQLLRRFFPIIDESFMADLPHQVPIY